MGTSCITVIQYQNQETDVGIKLLTELQTFFRFHSPVCMCIYVYECVLLCNFTSDLCGHDNQLDVVMIKNLTQLPPATPYSCTPPPYPLETTAFFSKAMMLSFQEHYINGIT